jgi:hypothetical protein
MASRVMNPAPLADHAWRAAAASADSVDEAAELVAEELEEPVSELLLLLSPTRASRALSSVK